MALGGGIYVAQNKVLPGAYINFISKAVATASLSDRGIVTMPLELDWGEDGKLIEVSAGDFQKKSLELFGYDYGDPHMAGLRDLFIGARTLLAYRLNGGGLKASNDYAEARYKGTRGNDLKVVIRKNVDNEELFDVKTFLTTGTETVEMDSQTVEEASTLQDNDFLVWKKEAVLEETAGVPLAGGSNSVVDNAAYQKYADLAETKSFHVMGIPTTDEKIKSLFIGFCKRMRDEMGVKFQLVTYQAAAADYMGVVSFENPAVGTTMGESAGVYWVSGILAGCAVNRSCQNKLYDGEFVFKTDYTQNQLVDDIKAGKFMLHNVGDDVRVLADINTMVTVTGEQGDIFKENQTIRVIDQIGNDIAVLFNTKYLGVVPNDNAGRLSLWSDIKKLCMQLERIHAIETFADSDIAVLPGTTKKAVEVQLNVTVVNAMGQLYMTVVVQ